MDCEWKTLLIMHKPLVHTAKCCYNHQINLAQQALSSSQGYVEQTTKHSTNNVHKLNNSSQHRQSTKCRSGDSGAALKNVSNSLEERVLKVTVLQEQCMEAPHCRVDAPALVNLLLSVLCFWSYPGYSEYATTSAPAKCQVLETWISGNSDGRKLEKLVVERITEKNAFYPFCKALPSALFYTHLRCESCSCPCCCSFTAL